MNKESFLNGGHIVESAFVHGHGGAQRILPNSEAQIVFGGQTLHVKNTASLNSPEKTTLTNKDTGAKVVLDGNTVILGNDIERGIGLRAVRSRVLSVEQIHSDDEEMFVNRDVVSVMALCDELRAEQQELSGQISPHSAQRARDLQLELRLYEDWLLQNQPSMELPTTPKQEIAEVVEISQ